MKALHLIDEEKEYVPRSQVPRNRLERKRHVWINKIGGHPSLEDISCLSNELRVSATISRVNIVIDQITMLESIDIQFITATV